jgi:hypothetical protein
MGPFLHEELIEPFAGGSSGGCRYSIVHLRPTSLPREFFACVGLAPENFKSLGETDEIPFIPQPFKWHFDCAIAIITSLVSFPPLLKIGP